MAGANRNAQPPPGTRPPPARARGGGALARRKTGGSAVAALRPLLHRLPHALVARLREHERHQGGDAGRVNLGDRLSFGQAW
jgi:hypothetical protein